MLKEHSRLLMFALGVADLATTALAWIAIGLWTGRIDDPVWLLPAVLALALSANLLHRLYRPRRWERFAEEFIELLRATASAWVALAAVLFLIDHPSIGWRSMLAFLALAMLLLVAQRRVARLFLQRLRSRGHNTKSVAVIGTGPMAKQLLESFERNPWYGFVVEFVVAESAERVGGLLRGRPIAADIAHLDTTLADRPVEFVYLALDNDMQAMVPSLVEALAGAAVEIRHVPDLAHYVGFGVEVGEIDGLPVMALLSTPLRGWRRAMKNALDRLAAALSLAALGLPMLAMALCIRRADGGPALFQQKRVGLDGRLFTMLKFRTYPVDSSGGEGVSPTRVGGWLRRFSLDELPQLINVLAGDMSLVGPRPETPAWLETYRNAIPRYMLRHRVKSGITGWAQVHGLRGDTSIERRHQYDLYYVSHWSFLLDAQILLMTLAGGFVDPAEPRASNHSP